MSRENNIRLRGLPAVGIVLGWPEMQSAQDSHGRAAVLHAVQKTLDRKRSLILKDLPADLGRSSLLSEIFDAMRDAGAPSLVPVVNATGILVHTNLGRAPLSEDAVRAVSEIAGGYSNLEYNLAEGTRGSRHDHVAGLLAEITGAEAGIAVNNNAAAVLLALNTLAEGREVIVSRGELIEIGGSFRIPEIMKKSGCRLVEVGTTNKTHPIDYRSAVTSETAVILKVHRSNFRMDGFVKEVPAKELAAIGAEMGVPVMEDLGSGSLIPGEEMNLTHEPTVQDSVKAGCALVTFSGDKLLGGPQAGVIAGRKDLIEACRGNPLARALRIDKMTLAALEATLRAYRDPVMAKRNIPILRAASRPIGEIRNRAKRLASRLSRSLKGAARVEIRPTQARVGGGALPETDLPSFAVAIFPAKITVGGLESALRGGRPPIIARIWNEELLFDLRSVLDGEEQVIENALEKILIGEKGP